MYLTDVGDTDVGVMIESREPIFIASSIGVVELIGIFKLLIIIFLLSIAGDWNILGVDGLGVLAGLAIHFTG